jgi:hypothetical protein
MNDVQVWYHKGCSDGFGAAWAAWLKLGDGADYVPLQYGDRVPDIPQGTREIYVLDFSFKKDLMIRLIEDTYEIDIKIVVLDHHKTAAEDLANVATNNGLHTIRIDQTKSGAVLAWEYFNPQWPVPELLLYVQDRDLWQWKMPKSRELAVWMRSVPFAFDEWSLVASKLADNHLAGPIFLEAGAMYRLVESQINTMVKHAWMGRVLGFDVPVVNAMLHQSEVGEELNKLYPEAPFSASYWDRPEGDRVWALRSRNGFDCQALARTVTGGGGHAGAAGFRSTRSNRVQMTPRSSDAPRNGYMEDLDA